MNLRTWEVTIDVIWTMTAVLIVQRFMIQHIQVRPPNACLELFTSPTPSVLATAFHLNHLHLNKTKLYILPPKYVGVLLGFVNEKMVYYK